MGRKEKQPLTKGVAKVPVVMQMEALECGAACLTMILAYYEKWIPLERVRGDCGVSRDGAKAKNILKAARAYGLTAAGYRYEPESLRKKGKFPCIVHWNFNHFVVLDGFRGNKAVLNDPARGHYTVPMEIFDHCFTGVCLLFEPGEDFQPEGKPKSVLAFARKRLKGAGSGVVFVAAVGLLGALFGALHPGFSRVFLDYLLTGESPQWLYPFVGMLSVLTVMEIGVSLLKTGVGSRLNAAMAVCGSTQYLWQVLHMPMEFFSQRMAGDILSRQSDNSSIAQTLVETLAPLVLDGVMMLLYLAVMLRFSVLLTAVGVGSVAVNLLMSRIISQKRINITRVQMRENGKLAGATVAGIEMIETIKASGAEEGFFQRWAGYQAAVNTQQVKYIRLNQYLGLIPGAVSALCSIGVLGLGAWLTMEGQFTVGMILAFQGLLSSFDAPASALISAGQTIGQMRTQMERVEDVMEYPADPVYEARHQETALEKLSGELTMEHVTFGYSKLEPPLIEDFSLHLEPGSRVAFVGLSGCGKSTLSRLISGLYQPWSGRILFDGKSLKQIDREVFTGSLAVVSQDIILFEDTIANNIKMWDSSIEDFEMILAARDAQIHEDIMQRDGGYQYRIQEGGRDFSGGQRQRMEIARVLAQDPTLIILDEATSALDARTECSVVSSIKERGITCIVVAHRLSTIRDCDEIIVLDHGKVAERGTHEELCARGGLYTQLVAED